MKQDMELRNIQQIEERKYQVEIMRLKTEVEELKRGSAAAPALRQHSTAYLITDPPDP